MLHVFHKLICSISPANCQSFKERYPKENKATCRIIVKNLENVDTTLKWLNFKFKHEKSAKLVKKHFETDPSYFCRNAASETVNSISNLSLGWIVVWTEPVGQVPLICAIPWDRYSKIYPRFYSKIATLMILLSRPRYHHFHCRKTSTTLGWAGIEGSIWYVT